MRTPTLEYVKLNSVLVRAIIQAGGTLEQCVCALFAQNEYLTRRCVQMEQFRPAVFVLNTDGKSITRIDEQETAYGETQA